MVIICALAYQGYYGSWLYHDCGSVSDLMLANLEAGMPVSNKYDEDHCDLADFPYSVPKGPIPFSEIWIKH